MLSSKIRAIASNYLKQPKTYKHALSLAMRAMSSEAATYQFETLQVTRPAEYVVQVELNRPEKRNAMNMVMCREFVECFDKLSTDKDCRAIVLSGAGKLFCSGIDLQSLMTDIIGAVNEDDLDIGRKAFIIRQKGKEMQTSFSCLENCPKPVIAAIHNACLGMSTDLITAADIRWCDQNAFFAVKEVQMGLASDVGVLQRFPKVTGNESLARELALTGRTFEADEAKHLGLVSRIFPDRESLISGAIEFASDIASKSPIAVQGTKVNLVYARDHTVSEGLDYVITWNQAMLQSEDLMKAGMAAIQKEKATFSKL